MQFAEFVQRAAARNTAWAHGWLNPAGPMHDSLVRLLRGSLTFVAEAKRSGGLKLPAKPDWIRARHCRRLLAAANTRVVMIWNRTARTGFVLDAIGAENCIHYEHGAAWFGGRERERRRYLDRIPLVLAISKATARVLETLWEYRGEIRVCRNALRPSLAPAVPIERPFPVRAPLKIGVAARLYSVKGVALALHTAKRLAADGLEVELHVAGDGPDRERLAALAGHLSIDSRLRFHGFVNDMSAFYRGIDCLLHLPLTEPFGLVAVEAAAHGCPIVAAAVDGLPEAVEAGVTGYCVAPTLPLADFTALGGSDEGVPVAVYDVTSDTVREPQIVDPAAAARVVQRLFATPAEYARIGSAASAHILREFRFDAYVDSVMSAIEVFARR
jgi:glycosyltransferase involved in cell wall biosynthesis